MLPKPESAKRFARVDVEIAISIVLMIAAFIILAYP